MSNNQGYHRRCFKCLLCNRTLDSTMHCDGPDKDIYCRGINLNNLKVSVLCLFRL